MRRHPLYPCAPALHLSCKPCGPLGWTSCLAADIADLLRELTGPLCAAFLELVSCQSLRDAELQKTAGILAGCLMSLCSSRQPPPCPPPPSLHSAVRSATLNTPPFAALTLTTWD